MTNYLQFYEYKKSNELSVVVCVDDQNSTRCYDLKYPKRFTAKDVLEFLDEAVNKALDEEEKRVHGEVFKQ